MKPAIIARVELVRLFRDRSNIFFVLILPLLLIVLIGALFGGGDQTTIGLVLPDDDEAAADLAAALEEADGVRTQQVEDADELTAEVMRGGLSAGLVVPDRYATAVQEGRAATVFYVGRPDAGAAALRAVVEAAVAEQARVGAAARAAADATGRPAADLAQLATAVDAALPEVAVAVEPVGGDPLAQEFAGLGRFDIGASSQLFLFVFLTAMTSGAALIQTRQHGIARRMLATPTSMPVILAGHGAGRFGVALFQAAYIVVATALVFGVNWGDPAATAAVVVLFSLAAAGAGLLVGATLSNDSQAAGVGVGLGLVLAALGGSMMPLELFPDGMRRIALFTPHAWANAAMADIVRRDQTLLDVLPQLGALAAYAAVLLTAAAVMLRRTLTR